MIPVRNSENNILKNKVEGNTYKKYKFFTPVCRNSENNILKNKVEGNTFKNISFLYQFAEIMRTIT